MRSTIQSSSQNHLSASNIEMMEDFYTRVLGFELTDKGVTGSGATMAFMTLDPEEHHQVFLVDGKPDGDLPSNRFMPGIGPVLHHLSFRLHAQRRWEKRDLLPRLAVGMDASGSLLFAAVDGRNVHRALGLTLAGMADLMIALGCRRACNLDGGSSKRMVVGSRTVDLSSTELVDGEHGRVRVRPVHTGILLFGQEDPNGGRREADPGLG